jgi:hypothetical protein
LCENARPWFFNIALRGNARPGPEKIAPARNLMRILVVEDDLDQRDLIKRGLLAA